MPVRISKAKLRNSTSPYALARAEKLAREYVTAMRLSQHIRREEPATVEVCQRLKELEIERSRCECEADDLGVKEAFNAAFDKLTR